VSNTQIRTLVWGCSTGSTCILKVPDNEVYLGAIVRTPWKVETKKFANNVSFPTKMKQITDGASNTMVVSEKFLRPDLVDGNNGNTWSDDRGWSDGWDLDTVRSTCYRPKMDTLTIPGDVLGTNIATAFPTGATDVPFFGSSHPGGFNAVFVDGSVHTINYEVEPLVFDRLGNREDGKALDLSAL
jgi:prepilin-type processing-associated H-X9-DG protein